MNQGDSRDHEQHAAQEGLPADGARSLAALGTESGSFVKYIFERHGREKLKQPWKGGESALHATLGLGLRSLQREWIEEVEAADATGIVYESE